MTHTCRNLADLTFVESLSMRPKTIFWQVERRRRNAVLSNNNSQNFNKISRITSLLEDGSLFSDLGITDFNATNDRAMVCGSIGLNTEINRILEDIGLHKGEIQIPVNMS